MAAQSTAEGASFNNMPKIPLDWNHATESYAADAQQAAAAGWIVARQYGPNGVWGRVEWTKRGAESVAGREVRYILPVLMLNAANEVLKSAALTNTPNLKRKAINSAVKGGGEMKPQVKTEQVVASSNAVSEGAPASAPAPTTAPIPTTAPAAAPAMIAQQPVVDEKVALKKKIGDAKASIKGGIYEGAAAFQAQVNGVVSQMVGGVQQTP